jgi:hypothetical protein
MYNKTRGGVKRPSNEEVSRGPQVTSIRPSLFTTEAVFMCVALELWNEGKKKQRNVSVQAFRGCIMW